MSENPECSSSKLKLNFLVELWGEPEEDLNEGVGRILTTELLSSVVILLNYRHHVQELILKGVFKGFCGIPLSGPDIQTFRKFQSL